MPSHKKKNAALGQPQRFGRGQCSPTHLVDMFAIMCDLATPSFMNLPQIGSLGIIYLLAKFVTCNKFSDVHDAFLVAITEVVEPICYQEATNHPHL